MSGPNDISTRCSSLINNKLIDSLVSDLTNCYCIRYPLAFSFQMKDQVMLSLLQATNASSQNVKTQFWPEFQLRKNKHILNDTSNGCSSFINNKLLNSLASDLINCCCIHISSLLQAINSSNQNVKLTMGKGQLWKLKIWFKIKSRLIPLQELELFFFERYEYKSFF